MLHGRGRQSHRDGQGQLAAWALKSALVSTHTRPDAERAFRRGVSEHLYEHGLPPEEMRIWMATYTGWILDFCASAVDRFRNPIRTLAASRHNDRGAV
jgi:hypothetical protein